MLLLPLSFAPDEPAAISVLLSGIDAEADRMMARVFSGKTSWTSCFAGQFEEVLEIRERPLVIQVLFPNDPEWIPAVQLLSAALASVYFRDNLSPAQKNEHGAHDTGQ